MVFQHVYVVAYLRRRIFGGFSSLPATFVSIVHHRVMACLLMAPIANLRQVYGDFRRPVAALMEAGARYFTETAVI
jgi:hypothetical protein